MELQHLMRVTYKTDAKEDYRGAWSSAFPAQGQRIVDVDWSISGEVTVTFLKSGRPPMGI